jgi:hypothetical protein
MLKDENTLQASYVVKAKNVKHPLSHLDGECV